MVASLCCYINRSSIAQLFCQQSRNSRLILSLDLTHLCANLHDPCILHCHFSTTNITAGVITTIRRATYDIDRRNSAIKRVEVAATLCERFAVTIEFDSFGALEKPPNPCPKASLTSFPPLGKLILRKRRSVCTGFN